MQCAVKLIERSNSGLENAKFAYIRHPQVFFRVTSTPTPTCLFFFHSFFFWWGCITRGISIVWQMEYGMEHLPAARVWRPIWVAPRTRENHLGCRLFVIKKKGFGTSFARLFGTVENFSMYKILHLEAFNGNQEDSLKKIINFLIISIKNLNCYTISWHIHTILWINQILILYFSANQLMDRKSNKST